MSLHDSLDRVVLFIRVSEMSNEHNNGTVVRAPATLLGKCPIGYYSTGELFACHVFPEAEPNIVRRLQYTGVHTVASVVAPLVMLRRLRKP